MTARDQIRRLCVEFRVLGYSGLGIFLASVAVVLLLAVLPDGFPGSDRKFGWILAVLLAGTAIGIAMGLAATIRLHRAACCPWCGAKWNLFLAQIASGRAAYCPYCERHLDGELPAPGSPDKPAKKAKRRDDELA